MVTLRQRLGDIIKTAGDVVAGPQIEKAREDITFEAPKGIVYTGARERGKLLDWISRARRDYTDQELRIASKLPLVQSVLQTLKRDLLSTSWRVTEIVSADGGGEQQLLEALLRRPNPSETWRTLLSKQLENILVVGRFDTEFLRARGGRAGKLVRGWLAGDVEVDYEELTERITKAKRQKGPIRGLAYYDPAGIYQDLDEHGILRKPAYYNVGTKAFQGGRLIVPLKKAGARWNREDFCRILYNPAAVAELYGHGVSPVELAYPLIDVLFFLLYYYKDKLENPTANTLVSMYQGKDMTPLSEPQMVSVIETVREDVRAGRMPVIGGVDIKTQRLSFDRPSDNLTIIGQFQVDLWTIFGVGLVEMGRVETSSRATAEAQVRVARRQAVGNLRAIIADDFVNDRIIADPHSDYKNLVFTWARDEPRPTMIERWRYILPWAIKLGVLTPEIVTEAEFPEWVEKLKESGVVGAGPEEEHEAKMVLRVLASALKETAKPGVEPDSQEVSDVVARALDEFLERTLLE